MEQRGNFTSKLGVVLAAAGSAVGLGNVWRFPTEVGNNGGAAFILIYLACVLFVGVPVMLSEFVIGRHTHSNTISAYNQLAPGKWWRIQGINGVFVAFVILSYYVVIAGWTLFYLVEAVMGNLKESADYTAYFNDFVSSPVSPLIYAVAFMALTHLVVVRGVQAGIEKCSKVMMPMLFFIVIAIAIYSLTLPGAGKGVEYLFKPDFSKIDAKVCAAALGQAFFSLSLGFGTILTYASYVDKKENIMFQSTATAASDLMFALIAGLAIMPAVFAFGLNPQSGPGLVFETLPFVFGKMPAGGVIAILFFVALLVAALTSSISMLEVAVAYLTEEKNFSRPAACVLLFGACWLVGALCSLSFGPLSDVHIFGETIFNFLDNFSSNILMTLGSLFTVLFVGWRLKKTDIYDEFTNGGTLRTNVKIFGVLWFLIRYICPVAVATIFLLGIF